MKKMLHSYQKMYLSKAQAVLGETFDYAINTCKIPGESFIKQFVVSSVSKRMENGEPAYLVGKSGIEIASDVVAETTGKELTEKPTDRFDRSTEYWIGWVIAYYQWWSGKKYGVIFKAFTFDELQKMYYALSNSISLKKISEGLARDIHGIELDIELFLACVNELNEITNRYQIPLLFMVEAELPTDVFSCLSYIFSVSNFYPLRVQFYLTTT